MAGALLSKKNIKKGGVLFSTCTENSTIEKMDLFFEKDGLRVIVEDSSSNDEQHFDVFVENKTKTIFEFWFYSTEGIGFVANPEVVNFIDALDALSSVLPEEYRDALTVASRAVNFYKKAKTKQKIIGHLYDLCDEYGQWYDSKWYIRPIRC